MTEDTSRFINEFHNVISKYEGIVLDKNNINEIKEQVTELYEHKDDYVREKKFKQFSSNPYIYLHDNSIEWNQTHATITLIEQAYCIHPAEVIEILFEQFLKADEDNDYTIKTNVLSCIWWIASWSDFSEKELHWIYSILRMCFESDDASDSYELKDHSVSIIEQIRNKVCLNILLDYNSEEYMDSWLLEYANQIIDELEEELSDSNLTDK